MLGAGVLADLYATADVAMRVTRDPEINVPVFRPQPMRVHSDPRAGDWNVHSLVVTVRIASPR
jgi:hypothetical protein